MKNRPPLILSIIAVACIITVGFVFIGFDAYASEPVVDKYDMRRMDGVKEQQIKELYQIEKEDLPTINRKPYWYINTVMQLV